MFSKWNIDCEVNCDGEKHKISAHGKGFDMEIKFLHDYCQAELKLSFLLRAFQGKFESIIKEELEKRAPALFNKLVHETSQNGGHHLVQPH